MKIRIVLIAALVAGLSLTGIAQQTQNTQSGSNTGSAQAGNEKPVGGKVRRQAKQAGQRVNVNTTNNSGSKSTSSMSQGSMKGTDNSGSSGRASQRSQANKGVPRDEVIKKNSSGSGRRAQ